MIWPFKHSETKKRIAALEQEVSLSRTDRYSKMFDLDRVGDHLEKVIKDTLAIPNGGKK